MICVICRQDAPLNRAGRFSLHRLWNRDRYTFCPMSGQPVPVPVKETR